MDFMYPIYTEQTECQDCYKCIRLCPVKAIMVENGHAKIIPEQCIMCGTCVMNCPSNAKRIRNDLGVAKQLIKLKDKVIVSLAPSFAAEFADIEPKNIIAALKKLGFYGVSETAIGADFVSEKVAEDLDTAAQESGDNNFQKLFLSSACPAVVEYIKQVHPDFSKYITNRASPLLAHSRYLKKIYGDDVGIVFIGPCIAKKREADTWDTIDCALTFSDLKNWLSEEQIDLTKISTEESDDFVPIKASKGALYPIEAGMIGAVKKYTHAPNFYSMTVSGISEIEDALLNLHEEDLKEPLFIEFLACRGGCINGPGTSSHSISSAIKRVKVLEYIRFKQDKMDAKTMRDFPKITGVLPKTDYKAETHSEEEIRNALRSVGKVKVSDELNCASCGYDTCRSFAKAMLDHRAEKTMCVSYMKKLAQQKANSLIKVIPSGVVIVDKKLEIVECNKNFAEMMGEDTMMMYEAQPGLSGAELDKIVSFSRFFSEVMAENGPDVIEREIQNGRKILHVSIFVIEKDAIAGAVIEDVTAPQVQKRRIVNQAQKVISKNLGTVQKIAFLLGENAAESESILNSIIESFSDEGEK